MKILLMGPPASGKGTVGEKLSEYFKIPLISVGAQLRDLPKDHPRYEEVKNRMETGELAPQDFVADVLRRRVERDDCARGYIMDGWGRKMIDLHYFDPGFDKVVALILSKDSAIKRISGRRMCTGCGAIYNIYYVPPKVEGICDVCGGELTQRGDDMPDVVAQRYQTQWVEAKEVVDSFRDKGILLEIDGEPAPDEVLEKVISALKE